MALTKAQKQQHFKNLRQQWQAAKQLAENNQELEAIYSQLQKAGVGDISLYNCSLIFMQAQALGLSGLPYLDFKTYQGWRQAGFQVKKGEKSPVFSITWIGAKPKEGEEEESDSRRWPKMTHLFHSSQVEEVI